MSRAHSWFFDGFGKSQFKSHIGKKRVKKAKRRTHTLEALEDRRVLLP